MIIKNIDILDYKLNKNIETEIKNKLFYISDEIVDFEIVTNSEYISNITFTLMSEIDIQKQLTLLIEKDFINLQFHTDKILWKSEKKSAKYYDIYREMLKKGFLYNFGCGRFALGGPLISLMDYLDNKIRNYCVSELKANEYIYPTMIDIETVKKCGYINNSPNMLFFVNYLHNDMENYIQFKEYFDLYGKFDNKFTNEINYCLPPTMCYHTYSQLAGTTITDSVYTAKGKAFRYENKYASSLERLWDFTIRETVFFGSYSFVIDIKNKILLFAQNLIDELKLVGYCSNANDLFFIDEKAAYKAKFQNELNSKIELRLNISTSETIAVGSFNYHDSFFCINFNIKKSGHGEFVSGCTGFGLERLVYAFIRQHGLDEKKWPI